MELGQFCQKLSVWLWAGVPLGRQGSLSTLKLRRIQSSQPRTVYQSQWPLLSFGGLLVMELLHFLPGSGGFSGGQHGVCGGIWLHVETTPEVQSIF